MSLKRVTPYLVATVVGFGCAFWAVYKVYMCSPLHNYEMAVYPMMVSAYTALLGFVIAASTIILTLISQPARSRGEGLIEASSSGGIQDVFVAFVFAKADLLAGIALALIALFFDRPEFDDLPRFILYGLGLSNCLLIGYDMLLVITILSITGNGILKAAQARDKAIMKFNEGSPKDTPFKIPTHLEG